MTNNLKTEINDRVPIHFSLKVFFCILRLWQRGSKVQRRSDLLLFLRHRWHSAYDGHAPPRRRTAQNSFEEDEVQNLLQAPTTPQ